MVFEVIFGLQLSNQPTFSSITPSIICLLHHSISALEKTFHLSCQGNRKTPWDGPLGRLPSVWQRSRTDKTSGGQRD